MDATTIGPNSVLQLREVLISREGINRTREFFAKMGLGYWVTATLTDMVPETVPARLFEGLFKEFSPAAARNAAREAGLRTADYILAHRIPKPVQRLLRWMPKRLAARMLLKSIEQHAWTFVGSGTCRVYPAETHKQPSVVEIAANPLNMPDCLWHAAVFERLFRSLVSRKAVVFHENVDGQDGPDICRFSISL